MCWWWVRSRRICGSTVLEERVKIQNWLNFNEFFMAICKRVNVRY